MNQKACLKEFLRYTALNVMGMIGLSCYILADTFFIAKGMGTNGLAALNLAIPVYSLINGSGLMLGMGGATKYAVFKGQKSQKDADRVFTTAVDTAAVLAAVFMIMGIFFSRQLAVLAGADAGALQMTDIYLKVILIFAPAFMMNNILICFVRNDGDPRLSMTAMLAGSFSNIILDYIFIFPLHMGIFGAVLATGWSPLVSMLILSKHKRRKRNGFHFQKAGFSAAFLGTAVSLGFPSLLTEVSSGIVIMVFNAIVWKLEGNVGIAAYGVTANLSLVVTSVYTGIAQGMQPVVSRAYGTGRREDALRNLCYGILLVLFLSAVIYVLVFCCAGPVTDAFNSEGNVRMKELAVHGIRLYFTGILFAGFNIVTACFFTSTERAVPAHVISILRGLVLIIPAACVLSSAFGLTGMWLAFPAAEAAVSILGGILCFRAVKTGRQKS